MQAAGGPFRIFKGTPRLEKGLPRLLLGPPDPDRLTLGLRTKVLVPLQQAGGERADPAGVLAPPIVLGTGVCDWRVSSVAENPSNRCKQARWEFRAY